MAVGHVYQQEKVCFSGKAASVYKLAKCSEEETQLQGAVEYEGQWN